MKICFVLSASNTKGANGAFIELIDSLDPDRFNPYVILPSAGPIVHELEIRSIPFKIFYYKWWMHGEDSPKWKWLARLIVNLAALPCICYQIAKWQCDTVYTNTIVINVGLFAAIILRKPHIFHVHEFGYEDHKLVFDFGKNFSLWLANKFTKYFIFISRAVANGYSAFIDKGKSKVIYQSVTILNRKSSNVHFKKHNFQCIIVGRITEQKGPEDAIKAINILIKEGLDVGLWIVGEGDQKYTKHLEKIVKENNISEYIIFCGWQDDPLPIVKKADVAFMCSRCEAFGRVTTEAMLMGKPVIGARSGGTTELIQEGFNGLFYTPTNYKELAEKIKFFYTHLALMRQMGKNGQRWAAKQFGQKRYGEEVLTVFKEILKY